MCDQVITYNQCPKGHQTDRKTGEKTMCTKLKKKNEALAKGGKPEKTWGECGSTIESESFTYIKADECPSCKTGYWPCTVL